MFGRELEEAYKVLERVACCMVLFALVSFIAAVVFFCLWFFGV